MLCRLLQGGPFHNETRIQSVIPFLDWPGGLTDKLIHH